MPKARGPEKENGETFFFEVHRDSLQCNGPLQKVESDGAHGRKAGGNISEALQTFSYQTLINGKRSSSRVFPVFTAAALQKQRMIQSG